ncbi:MAG TPA: DUF2786 domain-containing protein [Acidimicrobiia bacterium]|jgi:hypothetical protein
MGKNNRQRRAAKAHRRVKHEHARGNQRPQASRSDDSRRDRPSGTTRELIDGCLDLASVPGVAREDAEIAMAFDILCTLDPADVLVEAGRRALRSTRAAWSGGWQPAELVRQVQRTAKSAAANVVLLVIAADHAQWRGAELDPRWIDQVDQLPLPRVTAGSGWFAAWAEHQPTPWPDTLSAVLALLRCLHTLHRIPILIPPPGTSPLPGTTIDLASITMHDPILERVRALLAQAESTTFDAEAETFTAKAQELITKHAIDVAMLAAGGAHSEQTITLRLPIDDPYADAKSWLLHVVAENSRCRSVFDSHNALASVVGFASDVAATEMLFTSLLVQAQTAMQGAAARAPAGAHTRSRGFRSSFLVSFAHRIGARLEEINAAVTSAADCDGDLLPVLAARSSRVDAAVDEMFGTLRRSAVRGHDPVGWVSGQLAADRARLNAGDLAAERRARHEPAINQRAG